MSETLPPEITRRDLIDGVAFDLPLRPLDGARWLAALVGRSSVELRGETLVAVDRVGPFRWRRRRPTAGLRRFEVAPAIAGRDVEAGPYRHLAALKAVFEDAEPLVFAAGYPQPWLVAIANTLSARIESARPASLIDEAAPPVEVTATPIVTVGEPDAGPAARPPDTKVTVQENPDGVTVIIPPAGLLKGSKGLFVFGLFWCGFMAVFTAASIGIPLATGAWNAGLWLMVAFSAAFWAIGIGVLLGAVNMGRRRAIIDVVDDVLLVNRAGIFGIKSHQWAGEDLETVTVGPSGMSVNDVPVLELKVRVRGGGQTGLFAGRDADELRWIASLLRSRLGVPGGGAAGGSSARTAA